MPILPAEPSWFPAELFTEPLAPPQVGRQWWVLHTKPRQEKSLARQLHSAQVPFYLPLVCHRFRLRGRTVTSHVPLFAGYVFFLGDHEERLSVFDTRRVAQALEVKDQEGLWRDLRQVHRLISSGAPVTLEEKLSPGMTVEIKSGPLAGLKGQILRRASGRRFVVAVDFIQQGASVLLDDYALAAVQ
jgi:transcriptional antiterminator RfaH